MKENTKTPENKKPAVRVTRGPDIITFLLSPEIRYKILREA